MRRKWSRGQGLTEFAIVLPVLLLTIFLIVEAGRTLQAYVTVQNAAREGTRYAITGQGGPDRARNAKQTAKDMLAAALPLLDDPGCDDYCCDQDWLPEYYCIVVWSRGEYDNAGLPGERVQVQVTYNVRIITPILSALANGLPVTGRVEMINEPFGPTGLGHGGVVPPTLGPPPTFTHTPTPTYTPTPVPITIDQPLRTGATMVSGRGDTRFDPLVQIWDWTTHKFLGSGNIQADGTFRITVPDPGLIYGDLIRAIGTYSWDEAEVGGEPPTETPTVSPTITHTPTDTPTATSTGTSTPTPTSTPLPYNLRVNSGDDKNYVDGEGQTWLKDQAYSAGSWGYLGDVTKVTSNKGKCTAQTALYNSYDYGQFMGYKFDNVTNGTYQVTLLMLEPDYSAAGSRVFDAAIEGNLVLDNLDLYAEVGKCTPYLGSFPVTVTDGQLNIDFSGNTVTDKAIISGIKITFVAYLPTPTPTPGTPTSTPTPTNTPVLPPDLTITGLWALPQTEGGDQTVPDETVPPLPPGAILAWQPVTITTDVFNASTGPCNEFFWTDLYVYTDTVGPPPAGDAGIAWQGLNSLGPNVTTTLTFHHTFTISGTHYLYTQADSFQSVNELDETNNVGQPLTVTVFWAWDTPTPTPLPTPAPDCGSIRGTVWAFIGGQLVVPSERVMMSLIDESGQFAGSTESDLEGGYRFDCVAPATGYTVSALIEIDGRLYLGVQSGIQVLPSQETGPVDIILYPL